jgi:hypothetical protein
MKSSTFSLFAVGFILSSYIGMAALEQHDAKRQMVTEKDLAHIQCGNAHWTTKGEGDNLVITCVLRKPLRGGKAKP